MFKALATPRNRKLTFAFLAIFSTAAVAALVVGIADNLPGIALAFIATTALVLAFVHPWRTTMQFCRFLGVSILGLVVCSILHNIFEGVAGELGNIHALQFLLHGLGVVAFLVAILICPSAILVGAVGSVTMFIRNHIQSRLDQNAGA